MYCSGDEKAIGSCLGEAGCAGALNVTGYHWLRKPFSQVFFQKYTGSMVTSVHVWVPMLKLFVPIGVPKVDGLRSINPSITRHNLTLSLLICSGAHRK